MIEEAMAAQSNPLSKQISYTVPSQVIPQESCILRVDGIEAKIPIIKGTDGAKMLDIQTLFSQAKIFNYDPGYSITGSCNSTISVATPDGQLFYRGYAIQDLVSKCTYTEVCFILLYGRQPQQEELIEFVNRIKDEMYVHQKILDFYKGFSHDAHPMGIMCSVVAALSSFIHGGLDMKDPI